MRKEKIFSIKSMLMMIAAAFLCITMLSVHPMTTQAASSVKTKASYANANYVKKGTTKVIATKTGHNYLRFKAASTKKYTFKVYNLSRKGYSASSRYGTLGHFYLSKYVRYSSLSGGYLSTLCDACRVASKGWADSTYTTSHTLKGKLAKGTYYFDFYFAGTPTVFYIKIS